MSVATGDRLIAPHGGELVDRTGERPDGVEALETVRLTPRELSDLDMLASGALSPLAGFMGREDYERVVEEMRLANGVDEAEFMGGGVYRSATGVGEVFVRSTAYSKRKRAPRTSAART